MSDGNAFNPILDDPANFLHSINLDSDRAFFFRTERQILRDAAFIDGRSAIATEEIVETPLVDAMANVPPSSGNDRLIFNCSFCGSTLLSRLLDVPGRSLVLKEPRCLTDIAAWKIFKVRDGLPLDRLRPALNLARRALRRRFTPGEAVTVKVASQGNVLLGNLAEDSARMRPLFITISRAGFLRAIFRGGAERMHYAAEMAWHMAIDEPDGDALIKEAVRAGADPLRKAANLAVLARFLQVGTFQRAARSCGWGEAHVIDHDDIVADPRAAAAKAASALHLAIDPSDIDRNVTRHARRYAKQPDLAYSPERRRSDDSSLMAEHRQIFDDALAWGESALGPQRVVSG